MSTFLLPYEKLEDRWDIKWYIWKLDSVFPMKKLGKFIKERSIKVRLNDSPTEIFSILWVNNKVWVVDAYDELWKNINQSYKKVETNDITYNPYRVNVGSIWIVKPWLKWKYISPAYVVFYADEKYLLTEYLYLILSSNWFNETLRANTSGSVRQNLTFDLLSSLEIPVPEVSIQEKIVKTYNDIKTEISELENENQNLLKEVDNYLMKELGIEIEQKAKKKFFCVGYEDLERWGIDFNWLKENNINEKYKSFRLWDIAKLWAWWTPRRWIEKFWLNGNIPWLKSWELKDNKNIVEIEEKITQEWLNNSSAKLFSKWTLIIAMYWATAWELWILWIDSTTNQAICSIIPNNHILNLYLFEILKFFRPKIKRETFWGAQPNISKEYLENFKIPIPSIEQQKEILNWINNIKNKSKLNGERIEKLKIDLDEKIKGMILDGKDL